MMALSTIMKVVEKAHIMMAPTAKMKVMQKAQLMEAAPTSRSGQTIKPPLAIKLADRTEERMATADSKMILTQEKVGNVTVSGDVFRLLQVIVALFYITMNLNFQCTIKIK